MNMRNFGRLTKVLLLACLFLIPTNSLHAQNTELTEDFEDPALPGWERSENALASDGTLKVSDGGFAFHGGFWHDLNLTIQMNHPGTGEVSILYRESDAGSYELRIGPDHIALTRHKGAEAEEIIAGPNPGPFGDWITVDIIAIGDSHTINLNGNQVLAVNDAATLTAGGISLRYNGEGAVAFDDLTITSSGQAPDEVDESPPAVEETQEPSEVPSGNLQWIYTGGPPGGLGYDIRYNPSNQNTWYVTDAFAGVFISTDDGYTWKPSNTGIKGQAGPSGDWLPVFSLTIDPHDNNTIWVGTQNTGHIYKSTDGGETWDQKDSGVSIKYHALSFRGFTVDPRSSDIVYAMAETTRNDPNPDETGGQIYKTVDGGENWQLIWDGGMPSAVARYLWINPDDPDILYVSTGIFDRGAVGGTPETQLDAGLGVLKSTDGGANWQALGQDKGLELMHIGSLFMHPDDPDILFAAAGHLGGSQDIPTLEQQGYSPAGIYKTENGGESWRRVLEAPISRPTESFTSVEICESDTNIVYAGSEYAVYRSDDGGENWQLTAGGDLRWGPPGVMAGFPIDMQCDPQDPDRIFANNYGGGNFLSEDGGVNWINASQGYTGAHLLSLSIDPDEPGTLYTSGRNGLWKTNTGGSSWTGLRPENKGIFDLDTGAIAVDPSDTTHVLSGGRDSFGVIESWDEGQSWQTLWLMNDLGIDHIFRGSLIPSAIAFAPSNPQIVYIGASHENGARRHEPYYQGIGVLVSKDGGKTVTQSNHPSLSQLAVFDIAVDPTDANVAYAATGQGLYKTVNGGDSWELLNAVGDAKWVWTIAIHPQDPDYLILGVEQEGALISQDGGVTWQPGTTGWELNGSPSAIVFDPNNPQIVYMGDYFSGVFQSTDGGFTWNKMNQGLFLRNVVDMIITHDGNHLYAGTFGGGIFRLDLNGQPPEGTEGTETTGQMEEPVSEASEEPFFEEPPEEPTTGLPCLSGFAPILLFGAAWIMKRKR